MKKLFKYCLIIILAIIILIIAGGIFVSKKYKEEITNFTRSELEKQLNTKINFSDISFSLFKKFPNASFELKDFIVSSPPDNKLINKSDTIIFSKNLLLEINVLDFIRKKYNLNTVEINHGVIFLYKNKYGSTFDIFNKKTNTNPSNINLDLNKLILSNTLLIYSDQIQNINFRGFSRKSKIKGKILDANYFAELSCNIYINYFSSNNTLLIDKKNIFFKTSLNTEKNYYTINTGKIEINQNKFHVSGSFTNTSYQFNIKTAPLLLESLHSIIPNKYKKHIIKYDGKGKLFADIKIISSNNKNNNPHIEAVFHIKNGIFKHLIKQITLQKFSLDGEFSNGNKNSLNSSQLTINNFQSSLKKSDINGNINIKNLKNPDFDITINSIIFLEEFHDFINLDSTEYMNGKIHLKVKTNGRIENKNSVDLITKTGNIFLHQINFQLKENPYEIKNLNGQLTLNNNITIDSLNFSINKNNFCIDGKLFNLFNFLISRNQILLIEGNLKSNHIFLEDLMTSVNTTKNADSALILPDRLVGNLNFYIDNFNYKNFVATNIKGQLQYEPSLLDVKKVSFHSMDGKIETNGQLIKTSEHSLFVNSINELQNININKLFYSFNNFGQDVLKDKNLKGSLSGKIIFSGNLSEYLKINLNSVKTLSNIEINDGELIDFAPMRSLSKFAKLEELEHITFKTMKNEISIIDKTISIPQMDINTSAFNIMGSGKQYFNGNFDYRIKVHLSELLSKKARKVKKENEEFGKIEDNNVERLNLYFSVIGNSEDYKIRYDRQGARAARKKRSQKEKSELKKILYKEFGWYKKDSALFKNDKINSKFILETEDKKNRKGIKPDTTSDKIIVEWE